jgi:Pvc16 N-terminal domain
MAGVTAIQGVDDTLKKLTTDAVASLSPKPDVTVGPLDRDTDELRLNWFLYRISPNAAYWNMEPPATGWRTARGRPPLALRLQYLLTAYPASVTDGGDQEQFALGEGDPATSALAKPLVEPLRISLDTLDLDALSKLWTATTQPLRLSVGYEVSLVVVDAAGAHAAGPPVSERRVVVAPTLGPRLRSVDPARVSFGDVLLVAVEGLTAGATFTLAREPGDPAGPATGWAMTTAPAPQAPPGTVGLALPGADLAPGARRLDVTATESGIALGHDSIGLSVVPVVTGPAAPLSTGGPVDVDTAHAAPDVEVFLNGQPLDGAAVAFVSPTRVRLTLPATTPAGPAEIVLRAGKVAGPAAVVEVAP